MSLLGAQLVNRAKGLQRILERGPAHITERELAILEVILVAVLELVRLYRKTRG